MTTEEENVTTEEENLGSEYNSTCMICMEEWTIGSAHRLCCLKCGHLFGRSCIERWIKEKGAQAKCPTCNKPAKKNDLRDIWCKAVRASDDTEFCELQRALDQERRLRKTDSAVIFHQNLRLEIQEKELNILKRDLIERDRKIARLESLLDKLNKLRAQKLSSDGTGCDIIDLEREIVEESIIDLDVQPKELKGLFHYAEKIESSSSGGCKSFAICPTSSIILVAQPAPRGTSHVFGSFGLRKYSLLDTNVREFIPLHTKIITSIQLKPIGDLILTSSQDKKIRLTSINNNTCVQSYDCQYEPVSVAWSAHRDQQFYVGTGNCFVQLYDIRNTSECIFQTPQRIANTRLLSIAPTSGDGPNGLLVSDTKGAQFLEVSETSSYNMETIDRDAEHFKSSSLPFDGLMGTVDFDSTTSTALITTRRSPMNQNCVHNLVKLKKNEDENGVSKVECESVRTFFGGRPAELLCQSRILKHPTLSNQVLVGACDDSAKGIKLWDASDNTVFQSIRTDVFVRDIILYTPENTNQHVLYALSEKGLSIYRWDYA